MKRLQEDGRVDSLGPVAESLHNCISCSLCVDVCPFMRVEASRPFAGPRNIAAAVSRSAPLFEMAADQVVTCSMCGICEAHCPEDVNVPLAVERLRALLHKQRQRYPTLYPRSYGHLNELLKRSQLAVEPTEEYEDKKERIDLRREKYGLKEIEDRHSTSADVFYFPGCQAEERQLEIKEATKLILEELEGHKYTLPEKPICCGAPARLLGNEDLSAELLDQVFEAVSQTGARVIVTTCAGCTFQLAMANRSPSIQVKHLVEYLFDKFGLVELENTFDASLPPVKVSMHYPCDLANRLGGLVMEKAVDLLQSIPKVTYVPIESQSCCGGGGLVNIGNKAASNQVGELRAREIIAGESDILVTPCPACTAQLENSLFRLSSDISVLDLSTFIALRMKRSEKS
jgi:glycolate oxidase iron-sulfur subunit